MKKLLLSLAVALVSVACCCNNPKAGEQTEQTEQAAAPATEQTETEQKMIRLNVFVETTEGHLAEVVEGLNALAAASRAEEGCAGYEIFRSTVVPTRLIIVETWADDAALEAHKLTPHYTTILPPLADKMTMKLDRMAL